MKFNEYKSKKKKKQFYNSTEWKNLRQRALERDNYECQECKRLGKIHVDSKKVEGERKSIELNVHHIKEIEFWPELALDLNNLETLCLHHHNLIHDRRFTPQVIKWDDERW